MELETVFESDNRTVWRLISSVLRSNCYIVALEGSRNCAVIDPGLDGDSIDAALGGLGLAPVGVLCTHGHFDHVGSASNLQRSYGCPVYLHADDVKTLRSANFLLMALNFDARIDIPEITPLSETGCVVRVADMDFTFVASPGHTPGSCAITTSELAFTGDTLYARQLGLSRLPGENLSLLRESVLSLMDVLSPETQVLPGHGTSARLDWILEHNTELRDFLAVPREAP